MKTSTCFAILFFFASLLSAATAFYCHTEGETLLGFVMTIILLVNILMFHSAVNYVEKR